MLRMEQKRLKMDQTGLRIDKKRHALHAYKIRRNWGVFPPHPPLTEQSGKRVFYYLPEMNSKYSLSSPSPSWEAASWMGVVTWKFKIIKNNQWQEFINNAIIIFIIFKISIVGSRQPDGSGHMTLLCCRFLTAGRLLTSQCRFFLPIRRCFSINACLCAGLPSMPFKGLRQELKYANQVLLGLLLRTQNLLLIHEAW